MMNACSAPEFAHPSPTDVSGVRGDWTRLQYEGKR